MADRFTTLQAARDDASYAYERFVDLLVVIDAADAALASFGGAGNLGARLAPILNQAREMATQGRDAAARAVSSINKQVQN